MGLPHGANALVERDKITKYLMNLGHPEGSAKARFFLAMGFRTEEWQVLADALLRVATDGNAAEVVESVHGSKYIVDGVLRAPNGQTALVRTVWIKEARQARPRLVTAYPRKG
jgi:hypothetical protein